MPRQILIVGAALIATPSAHAQDGEMPLSDRLAALEEDLRLTRQLVAERQPAIVFSGYLDLGFFSASGDGSSVVADVGPTNNRRFPSFADKYAWVFMGDPLASAINTRGEVADRGNLPGTPRFDPIDSNGAPGFIANEANLRGLAALSDSAIATFSVNFLPRSGSDFRSGDLFEVDLAQVEWMLGRNRNTSFFVGKMESAIGVEYRQRKSHQRFGVTPSLMARYTIGTPLGLKLRSKFGSDERLVFTGAITNGSSMMESFNFQDEIDTNAGKTASGRLSYRLPLPVEMELGASGSFGSQDRSRDSKRMLWVGGLDLQIQAGSTRIEGQWLRGSGDGESQLNTDSLVRPFGLRLHNGGYLILEQTLGSWFGFWLRGEFRDAFVWLGDPGASGGAERLYVSKVWRATAGLRFVINQHITAKLEYLRNGEYGALPNIPNDVFTSSLVLTY